MEPEAMVASERVVDAGVGDGVLADRALAVDIGEVVALGERSLTFQFTPEVNWRSVIAIVAVVPRLELGSSWPRCSAASIGLPLVSDAQMKPSVLDGSWTRP